MYCRKSRYFHIVLIIYYLGRGWDREKIDQGTVIVQTDDRPIKPGEALIIMIVDNRTSSFAWTIYDDGSMIATEDVRPKS